MKQFFLSGQLVRNSANTSIYQFNYFRYFPSKIRKMMSSKIKNSKNIEVFKKQISKCQAKMMLHYFVSAFFIFKWQILTQDFWGIRQK